MTLQTDLQAAVAKASAAADKLHQVVHGPAAGTVETENGPVKTVAKTVADNEAAIAASRAELDQKVADAAASATSAAGSADAAAGSAAAAQAAVGGVKASANDATAEPLAQKLVAGANISLTEQDDGGDETLAVAVTGLGSAAMKNTGTAAGDVVEVQPDGKLPPLDGSLLVNLPVKDDPWPDLRGALLELAELMGDRLNMAQGWRDPLKDETDIDVGSTVNATFVATGGGFYRNGAGLVHFIPAMTGPSSPAGYAVSVTGTWGSSRPHAIFDQLVTEGSPNRDNYYDSAGMTFTLDIPAAEVIRGYRVLGIDGNARTCRSWTLNAWNGSAWVALDSRSGVTWGATAALKWNTYTFANAIAYSRFQIVCNASGADHTNLEQVQLLKDGPDGVNMTVVSAPAVAATGAPTVGRLHVQIKDLSGNATPNVDFKGWFSRDGGTTWTQGMLVLVQTLADGTKVYEFDNLDISGQPAGTAPRWKLTTHNDEQIELHGVVVQWK